MSQASDPAANSGDGGHIFAVDGLSLAEIYTSAVRAEWFGGDDAFRGKGDAFIWGKGERI